jgi:hypothetical protein
LLLRPEGWETRLVQIPLPSGVVAWFMDVNDASVGKLVRAAENDIRWIVAGLREGMLSAETIIERCRSTRAVTIEELKNCEVRLSAIKDIVENGDEPPAVTDIDK